MPAQHPLLWRACRANPYKEVPDDAVVNGVKVYVRLDHRYACFEVTVAVK